MRNKNSAVEVLNGDGVSEMVWVDQHTAVQMVAGGEYRWWDKKQKIRAIPRRESQPSQAALGRTDAEALAGLRHLSERRRGRIEEWRRRPLPVVPIHVPEAGQ